MTPPLLPGAMTLAVMGGRRLQHCGVPAGRDRQQQVVGLAQRAYLLGKHLVVVVVVGDGGQGRGIGGEREGGEAGALHLEAIEQLGGEVLGVGRRAAVAACEDLAVVHQALNHPLGGAAERLGEHRHRLGLGLGAFGEMLVDALDQVHRAFPD
jgi:hypothetical protein